MKQSAKNYAQALSLALKEAGPDKEDAVFSNFLALCVKNGDQSYLPKIVEEMENLVTNQAGGRVVVLEFARTPESAILAKMKKEFRSEDIVKVKINPSLHAGVRITIGGEQELDLSLNRRLMEMFSS